MENQSNRAKKLASNSLLFAIGDLSSKVIVFLLVPLYTYALSTEEYSISDLITTTVALVSPFFSLVIAEAVMRFALDKDSDKQSVFSIGFWVFFIGFIPLTALSYIVFQYVTILKPYWILFLLYYFSYTLYGVISNFVKGLEHLRLYTVVGILNTVLTVGLNLFFLIYMKWGIKGYLLSSIITFFLSSIIVVCGDRIWRYLISPWRINRELWVSMAKYSTPMIPNSAMWWINNSSDRYIVTYVISAAANGIYSVAYKIPSIFSVLTSIFMQAWQISVVEDFGTPASVTFFNKTYEFYWKCCVIVSSLLILSAKYLAKFLFLKEFYSAWTFSVVLIIGFCFHSLAGFLGSVYTSVKKTKMLFYSTAISAIVNIVLTFVLLKMIGVMGAAIATMLCYFIVYLIRRIDVMHYINISSNTKLFITEIICLFIQSIVVILSFGYIGEIVSIIIFIVIILLNKDVCDRLLSYATSVFRRKVN